MNCLISQDLSLHGLLCTKNAQGRDVMVLDLCTPGADLGQARSQGSRQKPASRLQAQYGPLTAASCGDAGAPPSLAAFRAAAVADRRLTVRDVWGLMLHSVRGALRKRTNFDRLQIPELNHLYIFFPSLSFKRQIMPYLRIQGLPYNKLNFN